MSGSEKMRPLSWLLEVLEAALERNDGDEGSTVASKNSSPSLSTVPVIHTALVHISYIAPTATVMIGGWTKFVQGVHLQRQNYMETQLMETHHVKASP